MVEEGREGQGRVYKAHGQIMAIGVKIEQNMTAKDQNGAGQVREKSDYMDEEKRRSGEGRHARRQEVSR